MWGVVTQLPGRLLGLWLRLGAFCLHVLALGLWALLFCLLLPFRVFLAFLKQLSRVARSVAQHGSVYGFYGLLQGAASSTQLARNCVLAHTDLYWALLDMLRLIPVLQLCEQAARLLFEAGVRAGRGLARTPSVATFVQLSAHTIFLGLYLCAHVCIAAISSKVHVRVHAPFYLSLPFKVHAPLNMGIKVKVPSSRDVLAPGGALVEVAGPQGENVVERKVQKRPDSPLPVPMKRALSSPRRRSLSGNRLHSWVVPSAATLIIVVCVGFLALMVVLGLVRIHSLHRRVAGSAGPPGAASDPKDPDLFWDDSALTIIVNPMESYQGRQTCGARAAGAQQDDEDSSDSDAADSPSSDERRIIETPPHRY